MYIISNINACILKAHSHSKSGGSIWASLECQCGFWIAGGILEYRRKYTPWCTIVRVPVRYDKNSPNYRTQTYLQPSGYCKLNSFYSTQSIENYNQHHPSSFNLGCCHRYDIDLVILILLVYQFKKIFI
jgi:hypothetical protein